MPPKPVPAPGTVFEATDIRPPRKAKPAKQARDALNARFLTDVFELWEEQGEGILRRAAFYEPMKFAQMVAGLMPKQIEMTPTNLQELPDERLDELLDVLGQSIAHRAQGAGAKARGREAKAVRDQPTEALPAVPQAARVPRGE